MKCGRIISYWPRPRAFPKGTDPLILVPGAFLVALLLSLTSVGNYLRREANKRESNL